MYSSAAIANESARLAAVMRYQILDTPPEPSFDRQARLAAHILDVPVALIVILDEKRQWFKARYGFCGSETTREISFCAHLISLEAPLVVHDASLDLRFAKNPLVTAEPRMRFYVGVPLKTPDGFVIGSLCGIDFKPRDLPHKKLEMLELIADQLMELLELRRQNLEATRQAAAQSAERAELCAMRDQMRGGAGFWASDLRSGYGNEKSGHPLATSNAALPGRPRREVLAIAMVSHELRAPLNTVIGLGEALLDDREEPLTTRQRDRLSTLRASSRHLSDLVKDILDVSRIELNMLRLDRVAITIGWLCDLSVAMVADAAERKRIALRKQFDGGDLELVVDRRRVMQILVNLLDNAVKFTPPGGQVRLTVRPGAQTVDFTIQDSGIGIAEADQDRLFTPFFQLDPTTHRKHQGTGLGLYLARRLAQLHGGDILVRSAPDQGSIFTLSIPRSCPQLEAVDGAEHLDRR